MFNQFVLNAIFFFGGGGELDVEMNGEAVRRLKISLILALKTVTPIYKFYFIKLRT